MHVRASRPDQRQHRRPRHVVSYAEGSDDHTQQHRALALHGLDSPVVCLAGRVETILGMVGAGVGYSIVPGVAGSASAHPGVRAFPIDHPDAVFPVYALWRPSSDDNPLIQAMLAALGG